MIWAVAISTRHRPFNTGAGAINSRVIINIAPCWLGHCTEAKPACNPLERKYIAHLPFFKGIAVICNYCNNRYNKADDYKYVYYFFFQDSSYVIPHLMRNPVFFFWIPAFAGMTAYVNFLQNSALLKKHLSHAMAFFLIMAALLHLFSREAFYSSLIV